MTASTTMQWLERYRDAKLAFTLVIDGFPLAITTSEDVDGVAAALTAGGAPWDAFAGSVYRGLHIAGEIKQEIKLFSPDISPDSLTFTVTASPGGPVESLFRAGYADDQSGETVTYAKEAIEAGATTDIPVRDASLFAASGNVNIGHELLAYTGRDLTFDANLLTGITRGVYSITSTDSGAPFAPAHRVIVNAVATKSTAPKVSASPVTWYGRLVTLILHHYDPLVGWNDMDRARHLWTGRIDHVVDNCDGTFAISAKSVIGDIAKSVMSSQWSGALDEGMYLGPQDGALWVYSEAGAGYSKHADLGFDEVVSHEELARAINDQLATWQDAGDFNGTDTWHLELANVEWAESPIYRFTLAPDSGSLPTSGENVFIGLSRRAWELLGLDWNGRSNERTPTENLPVLRWPLMRDDDTQTEWRMSVQKSPIVHAFHVSQWVSLTTATLNNEIGEYVSSTPIPALSADVDGVVQIGDNVWAVKKDGASLKFKALQEPFRVDVVGATGWSLYAPQDDEFGKAYRLGEVSSAPRARQVYKAEGLAGTELLKLLLSTGTSGYNHADYDVLDGSIGLGIPCSLVDVDSFLKLNDSEIDITITKPTPFYEILEPFLAITGRYLVWKSSGSTTQPKLTIVEPAFESAFLAAWELTEANKAGDQRPRVSYSADGLVNRLEIESNYQGDEPMLRVVLDELDSQTDHGKRNAVTVKARHVRNAQALVAKLAAPLLAYFSRPLATIDRTIDSSLIRMAPGDAAAVTDPYVLQPLSGVRGDPVYAWVLSTGFNFETGAGACQVAYLPQRDPSRVGTYAPSALVQSYNTGTKVVTCAPNHFSDAGDPADASRFAVGDAVTVRALDDVSGGFRSWLDEVVDVTGNDVELLTGDGAVYDAAVSWVLEYAPIGDVTNTAQRYSDFLADFNTGWLDPVAEEGKPYEYGADPDAYLVGSWTPGYANGVTDLVGHVAAGGPLSTHVASLAVDSVNSLLGYKTCPVYLNEWFQDPMIGNVGFPDDTIIFRMWIPHYGHAGMPGNRKLKIKVKASGGPASTTTYTFISSATPLPFVKISELPTNISKVTYDVTGTTEVMSSTLELEPVLGGASQFGQRGHYFSIGVTQTEDASHGIRYLHVYEETL